MTNQTTPAESVTEWVKKEFLERFNGEYSLGHYHGEPSLDITTDTEDVLAFISQALAKQKEAIASKLKEEIEEIRAKTVPSLIQGSYYYVGRVQACDELNSKLDNL